VTSKKHLRGTDSSGPEMLLYHAGFPRMCVAGTGHLSDQWSIFEIYLVQRKNLSVMFCSCDEVRSLTFVGSPDTEVSILVFLA